MGKLTLTFIAFLCACSSYSQGALDGFIDKPKTKNLALSLNREKASTYYLRDGDTPISSKFQSVSIFYKHQFTKWLGIAVNLPVVKDAKTPGAKFELHDGSAYLKVGKGFKINDNVSINAIGGIGYTAPLSNYEADSPSAIGQQAEAVNLRLITQITFQNRFFLNGRIGYDEVKSPTPSSSLYSIKLGYYKNKWYGDLWFDEMKAKGGKDYLGVGDLRPSTFRELGVSSQRIGGVVYHQTKEKLGFFLSGAQTIGGRNVRGNLRISIGGVLKL